MKKLVTILSLLSIPYTALAGVSYSGVTQDTRGVFKDFKSCSVEIKDQTDKDIIIQVTLASGTDSITQEQRLTKRGAYAIYDKLVYDYGYSNEEQFERNADLSRGYNRDESMIDFKDEGKIKLKMRNTLTDGAYVAVASDLTCIASKNSN